MPLARISLKKGRPDAFLAGAAEAVYEALRATFAVPENDKFVLIHQHEAAEMVFDRSYLGIARTDGLVFIQITANDTRTTEQKKALYKDLTERLVALGVEAGDVAISLVGVKAEDWCFGDGKMAYPPKD